MKKRLIAPLIAAASAVFCMVGGAAYAQSGEKFVLTGVVYVEGGRGLAWLQEPTFTNDRVVIVRVGDSIGPYRLTKVSDDQVELEGPDGKVSVPLAGGAGAISVAAIPGTEEATPGDAHANANASPQKFEHIVVPREDPRRGFPMAALLPGTYLPGMGFVPTGVPAGHASAGQSSPAPQVPDRGIVPPSMQTLPPELPPHPALNNPNAIVIPRGDPRREFPAAALLIGAGAPHPTQ